jgi:hypothetical protein
MSGVFNGMDNFHGIQKGDRICPVRQTCVKYCHITALNQHIGSWYASDVLIAMRLVVREALSFVQDFGLMDMFLTFVVKQNAGTWDIPRVAITLFIFGGADAVNRDIGFLGCRSIDLLRRRFQKKRSSRRTSKDRAE